jgi:hypothetical protein
MCKDCYFHYVNSYGDTQCKNKAPGNVVDPTFECGDYINEDEVQEALTNV